MKPAATGVLLLLCLGLGAPKCLAAGINLSWNACTPEGGVQQKSFACTSNSGIRTLYGSFALAQDAAQAVGIEVVVDITTQSASLPSWWQLFSPGSCRPASLSVAFEFSTEPGTICNDPWGGQATGGIGAYQTSWTSPPVPSRDPRTARIRMTAAVPQELASALIADTEYYGFKLNINSAKTVGTSACSGCLDPVCIKLISISVVSSNSPAEVLTQALVSSVTTWQSATNCTAMMNQRALVWGAIRALYR